MIRDGASFAIAAGYLGLAWALAGTQALAQGGPPMLTDDPDTPGDGRWEINTAYIDTATPGDRLRGLPHVDVNYGLGDRLQLKYETGFVARHPWASDRQSGVDDALFGAKWRFLDQSGAGANVSTYPQYQVVNSRSSVARGLAADGPNLFVPVEVSRDFGHHAVVAEVGYQFLHVGQGFWVSGVLAALPIVDGVEALAEIRHYGATPTTGGETLVDVGFRAKMSEHWTALGSIGKGIESGPGSPTWTLYLGLQATFGDTRR